MRLLGWRISCKKWCVDIWSEARSFHFVVHVRSNDNVKGIQFTAETIGYPDGL